MYWLASSTRQCTTYRNYSKKKKITSSGNVCVLVAQSCLTLSDPMDCSSPGSFLHGIFQARILEWVAVSFSRGSSWPRDRTCVPCIASGLFTFWATWEAVSAEDTAVNQMDSALGPLGSYILVDKGWASGTDKLSKSVVLYIRRSVCDRAGPVWLFLNRVVGESLTSKRRWHLGDNLWSMWTSKK